MLAREYFFARNNRRDGVYTNDRPILFSACGDFAFCYLDRGQEFSERIVDAARAVIDQPPPDPDASLRKDLTHLKVYAVDSEDTMEVRSYPK